MNLKKGKIEINGILLEKDVGMGEVIKNSRFHSYTNTDGKVAVFTSEQTDVEGYIFNVKVFFKDKRLSNIKMTPIHLKMKDPLYPSEKYQAEKKKVCDLFLRKELGEPTTETESVVFYEYDWGTICSVTFLKGRNEYTGGFIEIDYN